MKIIRGKNLIGKRFGRLTVIGHSHSDNGNFWLCSCSCGGSTVKSTSHLNSQGDRNGCGCMKLEQAPINAKAGASRRVIHGMSGTKLKTCYDNMYKRCYVPSTRRYERYGGRGITICAEWLESRKAFYGWAVENGYEEGKSIERVDVDLGYSPENCKWIEVKDQQLNTSRSVHFDWCGEKLTLGQICRKVGIASYQKAYKRIRRGWDLHDAVTKE